MVWIALKTLARVGCCVAVVYAAGCADESSSKDEAVAAPAFDVPAPAAPSAAPAAMAPAPGATGTNTGAVTGGSDPAQPPPPAAGAAAPPPATPPGDEATPPPTQPPADMPPADPTMEPPPADPNMDPAGPEDGDPSGPVVTIPEVACGGPAGFGAGANFDIGGREMIVTYPCNKRAGAPMTFFLNLHGTTPVNLHFYQHSYFAIHQYAESHNIIVVTPSSVVQQWGNGDGGQDEPHLMEIIDWVYATFDGEGAFDIRAMWVGGHSWGAMYTGTFACKPELADKVIGAVSMSGSGRNLGCAERISVISSAAEDDIGPVIDQGTVPSSHGCGSPVMNVLGNNEETHWPDCDPGFVHANYFMLGKSHSSSIDAVVVERVADLINIARP